MKLVRLLQCLHPDEYHDLEKFLRSPFFKASEQYLTFFRYLRRCHPGFELNKTALQAAYRTCFGARSLTDSRLYNLLSGLSRQIERFLVMRTLLPDDDAAESSALYNQLLVQALAQRQRGSFFRAEARRRIESATRSPLRETDEYVALQQMHYAAYFHPDTPRYGPGASDLDRAMQYLDHYYCLAKLRYAAEMKAREFILQDRFDVPLLDAVLHFSAAMPGLDLDHPLWSVYFRLTRLYQQGIDEPAFREMLALFNDRFSLFPRADQRELLRQLINQGIAMIARDCAVESELLALYRRAIDADMLLDGDRITPASFLNIANLASVCQEFEWAAAFIARFASSLEEAMRPAGVGLARAGLLYNQGQLDAAQECLPPEIFTIPSFDLPGRILLLKIVFDRYLQRGEDYEFLMTTLRTFEKYIGLKPLTVQKKEAHLRWLRFLRKMAGIKFEHVQVSEPVKAALHKRLKRSQPIVSKKWLLDKIGAL